MRYAFIINPVSGKGSGAARVERYLEQLERVDKRDIEHYMTAGSMDAERIARSVAEEAKLAGKEVCVYAVGGDGTLNEVANGLYGYENALLGAMPAGSGNDFIRCFDGVTARDFMDVEMQLAGTAKTVDLIEFKYQCEGKPRSRICVNGINIGIDGNTAIMANRLKRMRFIGGEGAYIASLITNFALKKGENLAVTADGELIHDGPVLLCTVGNGGFCGGGFESCPRFDLTDGLAELFVIQNISRRKFISLVPKYKAGRIFEVPGIENFTDYTRAGEVIIEPKSGSMQFVVDGETVESGSIEVRVLEDAIRVLVPQVPQQETALLQ